MSKKIHLEQHQRFSKSVLWQVQRDYFDQEGINAWVNQVPFYVTSNPYMAKVYATLVISFVRDWIKLHPESKKHPFYIMELGTGSGQFSFYVLKKLHELRKQFDMDDVSIVYIMSDFTKSNIEYWAAHPALKPFQDQGLLDFAIYNLEGDEPITLHNKKIALTPEHFANPLSVFANYIFDTVSHDIFSVKGGKLHEVLISLTTSDENMRDGKAKDWERVAIDYEPREIHSDYYSDPDLNKVLFAYRELLKDSNFLFPIGGLLAIKKLKKLTNDKIFLISSDKGYSDLSNLENLGYPSLAFHGSFSMMVNFHAIGEYFKQTGGDFFLQTERKGLKSVVFSSGFDFKKMPETRYALDQWIEGLSPADYFILHRRMSDTYPECNIDAIASHLALTGWDPYIFHKLNTRICPLVDEADPSTIAYLASNMHKIAANYYYMPKSDNAYFEVAVFYHMIKDFKNAVKYYLMSEQFCTDSKFGLFYNVALCQYHMGEHETALESFKKAAAIDSSSKETSEWVTYLEATLNKNNVQSEA